MKRISGLFFFVFFSFSFPYHLRPNRFQLFLVRFHSFSIPLFLTFPSSAILHLHLNDEEKDNGRRIIYLSFQPEVHHCCVSIQMAVLGDRCPRRLVHKECENLLHMLESWGTTT